MNKEKLQAMSQKNDKINDLLGIMDMNDDDKKRFVL